VTDYCIDVENGIPPLLAFVPFVPLIVRAFRNLMPLKWVFLFTDLETISLLAFYLNFVANDFFWCFLSICAYILIATPLYININNVKIGVTIGEGHPPNLTFSNLFRTCAKAVFSDYRIALLSRIPLALQVLAGGSLLYEVFGADWILHALAGFGVGALALKAYVTGVRQFSYSRLASYFHLARFRTFQTERKTASAEFTLFSIFVVALVWEVFERGVYFISPVNVFRVGWEPLWNICGDISFAAFGGMIGWYILTHKANGY
jgi:hypothetical protein